MNDMDLAGSYSRQIDDWTGADNDRRYRLPALEYILG